MKGKSKGVFFSHPISISCTCFMSLNKQKLSFFHSILCYCKGKLVYNFNGKLIIQDSRFTLSQGCTKGTYTKNAKIYSYFSQMFKKNILVFYLSVTYNLVGLTEQPKSDIHIPLHQVGIIETL